MTVNERIAAVHILQRFVKLSRTLLPLYSDLINKSMLSVTDRTKILKIKYVYDNFHADPHASQFLVNSNILALIQRVYYIMDTNKAFSAENLYEYDMFIEESDRLIDTWNHQQLN